jgi:hypothetical protein
MNFLHISGLPGDVRQSRPTTKKMRDWPAKSPRISVDRWCLDREAAKADTIAATDLGMGLA